MKQICELNDKLLLGQEGRSAKAPLLTARAIVRNRDGRYAVMYTGRFHMYSLPGGGVEAGEDILSALRREVSEETGCTCDEIEELGIICENCASLDITLTDYYYVVTTDAVPGELRLTEAEQANRFTVEWHTLEETVRLITGQSFERTQAKYLNARDVAALREYTQRFV